MTITTRLGFGSCLNAADSGVFARLQSMQPHMLALLGDLWYEDKSNPTQGDYTTRWNTKLFGTTGLSSLVATIQSDNLFVGWSDHDYGFQSNSGAGPLSVAANAAYRSQFTYLQLATEGIYRTRTVGRVRYVLLDERTFKSANGAQDGPNKTVLGATQKAWLKGLLASNAYPLIVVMGDIPWVGEQTAGDDGYKGYHTERQELEVAYAASPASIVRLNGDMHCLAAGRDQFGIDRVWQAAPFKNETKVKDGGAGYAQTYPRNQDEGPVAEVFGMVTIEDTGPTMTATFRGYTADGQQRISDVLNVPVVDNTVPPPGGGGGGGGPVDPPVDPGDGSIVVTQQEFDNLTNAHNALDSRVDSLEGRMGSAEGALNQYRNHTTHPPGGAVVVDPPPTGGVTEKTHAAEDILARVYSGLTIAEDWTWSGAPGRVATYAPELVAAFRSVNPLPVTMFGAEARSYLASVITSGGGVVPTQSGGNGSVTFTAPQNLRGTLNGRVLTLQWDVPAAGTPTEYEVHEFKKYPTATYKASVTAPATSRVSGTLQPAELEYGIRAKNAAGQFTRFSNTINVIINDTGGNVLAGKPPNWDTNTDPVEPTDPTDDDSGGGGDPTDPGNPTGSTGTIPWTRVHKDNTPYATVNGGGTAAATSLASLASATSGGVHTYTGSTITGSVTVDFTGKSNVTIRGIKVSQGGRLICKGGTNILLEDLEAPFESTSGGETVKWVGNYQRVRIHNSLFGPAVAQAATANKTRYIQFGDSTAVGARFAIVSNCTFLNKSSPGNMIHTTGDTPSNPTGGVAFTLVTQNLFDGCRPFDENDHEANLMGISSLQLTNGHQIVEFNHYRNCRSEPEVISMKMNWSTIRGNTFHSNVGSVSLRHGDDGEINDNWIFGFEEEAGAGSYNRTSAGPRLYGARHKVHHNTVQVNGNGGSRASATALFESPLTLDAGDVAPGTTSNAHANIVGVLVEKNLLVKCGNPIMVVKNYGTAPTGTVKDNWVVECANAPADGVGVKNAASKTGLAISGNVVYATTAAAGLVQGTNGEWKAPASADRGARTPYITTSMVGRGASWNPWSTIAGPPDGGGGGGTASNVPGTLFDLSGWYLTLPNAAADPTDVGPQDVYMPSLGNFTHQNFYRAGTDVVFKAPVQGETTSSESGATRSELREMVAGYSGVNGAKAAWSMTDGLTHTLEWTERTDATGPTDRKEAIVGQIHSTGGTPPLYLLVNQNSLPGALNIFKNGPSDGTLLSGIGVSTVYSVKIVVGPVAGVNRVRVYADLGTSATTLRKDYLASDFSSATGCYFKKGVYNKSTIAGGATGTAIVTCSKLLLNGSSGTGPVTPPPPSGAVQYPMDLFPDYWYLTTPEYRPTDTTKTWNIYKDGGPSDVNSPDLDIFYRTATEGTRNSGTAVTGSALPLPNAKRLFMLNPAKNGVIMSADYDGSHTPNSENTRMELREQTANGLAAAVWSTNSGGPHRMMVVTQVDRLDGNHLVIGQIHGAKDDVTVFRVEGSTLWRTDGNTAHGFALDTNLALGTIIAIGFSVQNGNCDYYYAKAVPADIAWDQFWVPGNKKNNMAVSDSGCYFKAGIYLQRKGAPGSWGQCTVYQSLVRHS